MRLIKKMILYVSIRCVDRKKPLIGTLKLFKHIIQNLFKENHMETQLDTQWLQACKIEDAIENGGVCLKLNNEQVALFYFARRNEWYATQNECPHKRQMILSRGMLGSLGDTPKVACPFHKKT